jgi:hypothetical protein
MGFPERAGDLSGQAWRILSGAAVACMAHKSLEICAPKDFGASRGILRLRRTIPLLLEESYFETACVDSYVRKQAHPPRRMSYLARNSDVAANLA